MLKLGAKKLKDTWLLACFMLAALFYPLAAVAGPDAVTLTSPTGTLSESSTPTTVAFSWEASTGSTYYKVLVTNASNNKKLFRLWYTASDAGCSSGSGTCSVTPSTTFDVGSYSWSITPYGDTGLGTETSGSFDVENAADTTVGEPSGTIESTTPTYQWNATSAATYYQLRVTDSSGSDIHKKWYTAADSSCSSGSGTCSVTPSLILTSGSYVWYIKPWTTSAGTESGGIAFEVESVTDNNPGTPTPTTPSGTITDTTPTYSWAATDNSTHYTLVVSNGSANVINQQYSVASLGCGVGTGTCSVTPASTLTNGTSYSWTVLAYNSNDDLTGVTSGAVTFSVDTSSLTPGTPSPSSPSGTITTINPAYKWTATANSTHYTLVVNDGSSNIINQQYTTSDLGCSVGSGTCTITPSASLTEGSSYTWTLLAYNSSDNITGTTSSAVSFNVDSSSATTGDLSPAGTISTSTIPTTLTFEWPAVADSTYYKVKIKYNTAPYKNILNVWYTASDAGCSSGSGMCSVVPSTTFTADYYSWSVAPYGSTGIGTTSEETFVIEDESTATTTGTPNGTITESTPTFKWSSTSGAVYYQLRIINNVGSDIHKKWYTAATVNCSGSEASCSYKPDLIFTDSSYSWFITPWTTSSGGESSAITFTVDTQVSIPGTPTPISPIDATSDTTPTYSWGATSSSTHYTLKVTGSSGTIINQLYSNSELGCEVGSGTCSITPDETLSLGSSYSWTIQPYNNTESLSGSVSDTATFSVALNTPATPSPLTPLGNITDKTPPYIWQASEYSTDYILVVKDSNGNAVINQSYSTDELGCEVGSGTCTITPDVELSNGESYSWTLLPFNSDGSVTGTVSNDANFSVQITPGTPTPSSPSGSTDTLTPTFIWAATQNSTDYTLVVTDGSSTIINQTYNISELGCLEGSGTCSINPSVILTDGKSYSWTLLASNSDGPVVGTTSDSVDFDVALVLNTPGTPTPISPVGTASTTTPTYGWLATEYSTHYTLLVTDSSSNVIINQQYGVSALGCAVGSGTCFIQPATTLTVGETYTWTLEPYNSETSTAGTTSGAVGFTVTLNTPDTPVPLSPIGTTSLTTPSYSWTASTHSTHYTLVVTDSLAATVHTQQYSVSELGCSVGVGTCSVTPAITLTDAETYSWTLLPYNSTDNLTGIISTAVSFTVDVADTTPETPIPLSPIGDISDTTPTFTWGATANSTHYTLAINSADGGNISQQYTVAELGCTVGAGTCSATLTAALTDNTDYTWTVTPYNSTTDVTGTTSNTASFRIGANVPGTPTLISPSITTTTINPEYSWAGTDNSTHFVLTVSNSSGTLHTQQYSVDDLGCSVGSGTCAIRPNTDLTDGLTYTWKVTPYNSVDKITGTDSSIVSFTVALSDNVPGTPIPSLPSGTTSSTTPTYSWAATQNSTDYTITLTGSSGTLFSDTYNVTQLGCSVGSGTCSITPNETLIDGESYTWTLLAYNSTDALSGTISSATSFTVEITDTTPATPTLISPSGTIKTLNPTYSWNASTYSTHYTVLVKIGSGTVISRTYSTDELGCSVGSGTCSVTPSDSLSDLQQYNWTVVPYNSTDNLTGTSPDSLDINTFMEVILTSPEGSAVTDTTPTYQWEAISNAELYKLNVTNASGTVLVDLSYTPAEADCSDGTGICSVTPTTDIGIGEINWSITVDPEGNFGSGTFTTILSILDPPAIVEPNSTVESTTVSPTFIWTAVEGATDYFVTIVDSTGTTVISGSMTASQANCASGTGTCDITPQVTFPTGEGTWSVMASDSVNNRVSSTTTTTFTISEDAFDAGGATPISPNGTELTSAPTFTWTSAEDATDYKIVIIDSSGTEVSNYTTSAATAGCDDGRAFCSLNFVSLDDGDYSWTVQAYSSVSGNFADVSSSLSFTIADASPPEDGDFAISPEGIIYTTNPSFIWTAIANSSNYRLKLFKNNKTTSALYRKNYTPSEAGCDISSTCTVIPNVTLTTGTYVWEVKAFPSMRKQYLTFIIPESSGIILTGTTIDENLKVQTRVGQLYIFTSDGSEGQNIVFTLGTDSHSSNFEIKNDDELWTAEGFSPDFEEGETSYLITVHASSVDDATEHFTITVNDANDAPTDIELSDNTIWSNVDTTTVTTVGTLSATDIDVLAANLVHVFTVTGGIDEDSFEISGDLLQLKAGVTLDTSVKEFYYVEVTATDSGGSVSKTFTISIVEAGSNPTAIILSSNVLPFMDRATNTPIGTLSTTDADVGDTFTYTIDSVTFMGDYPLLTDYADSFYIDGDQLNINDSDGSVFGVFEITITVTDSGGFTLTETFTLSIGGFTVEDIPESNPTVAAMLAAAKETYTNIYDTLQAASSGTTVDVTETELENMIIGKVGQQISSGGEVTSSLTDIVKQFNLELVSSSEITVTIEVGVIDVLYNRLPATVQTEATSLFSVASALLPYANDDYTAGVRFRIVPVVSGTTLSFDTSNSYIDVLVEDSLLTPNLQFTVAELITKYNSLITTMSADGLTFFGGQDIPTSQDVDYFFPNLISSFSISAGKVTLTR
ncbi:MAG: cadherin repeat domain-containing protein [Magnetococcales bacterium]|nr:cadherin repeat domain-containing protein [Magnetococcales bacterium]